MAKTKDFAKVIRAKLAADPELAARIEQERAELEYDPYDFGEISQEEWDRIKSMPVPQWVHDAKPLPLTP